MQRRDLLSLGAVALLSGCGFELRREPDYHFKTLALTGFVPHSPLAQELRRQVLRSPLKLVEDPNRADVIIDVEREIRDKTSVATTTAGQITEWQLRLQLDYSLRSAGGDILLPRTELRLTRDMNYSESAALAKEQEEASLQKAMQVEAVGLLLRRLAAVRLSA
ncbi:LPS assembly lipoprotein LptE [Roseateles amylovorans]|uniref:LPS-assembly lipoprotein LptE n=1 Tax=Roseateles amylovorans TaxID=2978473 RepID=A0ABY6B2B5_9BURK|nr:LPS assembly lipoprotein LptE [Roseateles amylovorans]UXH78124.1 LPS assembly lipoprotein LptE [Roseateles amylovorans]